MRFSYKNVIKLNLLSATFGGHNSSVDAEKFILKLFFGKLRKIFDEISEMEFIELDMSKAKFTDNTNYNQNMLKCAPLDRSV